MTYYTGFEIVEIVRSRPIADNLDLILSLDKVCDAQGNFSYITALFEFITEDPQITIYYEGEDRDLAITEFNTRFDQLNSEREDV